MRDTYIQILGENGGILNIKDDTSCPLNFAVADIKDLSKRKGAFSKTITIVSDSNSDRILGYYFDVNIAATTFDINRLVECNIIQNGVPVLQNGLFQLVGIKKVQKDNNYEDEVIYEALVKDNISDFFTQLGNKELTDLTGFKWMSHIYTANSVINSFSHSIVNGYKYIMPYTPEGNTLADREDASLDLTEFSPGIYAKIYFDKIFQQAGFSYQWDEMDSAEVNFSKLIIPFNGEKPVVNAVEVLDYTATVENNVSQTISTRTSNVNYIGSTRREITQSTPDRIIMPNEISDPSNRWNPLGSFYNPPNLPSNQNSIEIEYEIDWELVTTSFGTAYLKKYPSAFTTCAVIPQIKMRRYNTSQYLASTNILDNGELIRFNDGKVIPNGVTVQKTGTSTFKQLAQGIDPAYNIDISCIVDTSSGWMFKTSNNIAGNNATNTSFGLRITDIRCKVKSMVEGTYGYNIPVDMTRYIPQKFKQSDFIKSIFTMFNVFVDTDPNNNKKLILKSRDKYYDDGKILDWTNKLVKDKEQNIKFLPEISSKVMLLTYKEDSDISNKIYKEAVGEIYGQQKFTFDNEYSKDEKKTEIMFSPTPMFNTSFGAVCPMWLGGAPKCNLRILYDGGVYSCNTYNIVNYRLNSGTINQVSTSFYPYIGHWDKPNNPTFDLNFGICDFYFRSDDYIKTNNNLFNLHWRRTLNQINNGKLMTAYFDLNELDILNMRLNDKVRIDNSWWNINKIQDYNVNGTNPTKVELVSIDDNLKIPFVRPRKIKLIRDLSTDLIAIPIRTLTGERDKFLSVNLSPYDIEIKGKYNYITNNVTSATVVGNGNLVSENSFITGDNNIISAINVTVNGSNNIVEPDAYNSVINTSGETINEPNTTIVNNIYSYENSGDYVRGWEKERENGNTITVGKSKGKLLLTNGTNSVIGIGTSFSSTDLDGLGNLTLSVYNNDNELIIIDVDTIVSDTEFIFDELYDYTFDNILGTEWLYETGEYDWYAYARPSAIGVNSVAMNTESIASGFSSAAFNYSRASGQGSVTFNSGSASALLSAAFGDSNASGQYSVAFGRNCTASGFVSLVSGESCVASTAFTTAMGSVCFASAPYATSIGWGNTASGQASVSLGAFNITNGTGTFASGYNNNAIGWQSSTIGYYNISNVFAETVIGCYSATVSGVVTNLTGVSDSIFRVGTGNSEITRKDSFRVYRNDALYMRPSTLTGVTNSQAGFLKLDENSKLNIHNGTTWSMVALTSDLTNFVTTNTTQTITGNKQFDNVRLIKKNNTSIFPTQSGGNFYIGNNSGYDSFDFYSLDGSDQDSFGVVQIYSNPEEGNNIRHTSLDNNQNAIININYNDFYFRHEYGGVRTSLYIDGITDKIILEGTQNKFAALGTNLISGTKNFEFPNTSGTIALTSDLTLQNVVATGATSTNTIYALGGLEGGDSSVYGGYSKIDSNGVYNRYFEFLPGDQYNTALSIDSTGFGIINNKNLGNTTKAILSTSLVTTSDKIFNFPNTSGVLNVYNTTDDTSIPSSSSDSGSKGEIRVDISNKVLYVCVDTDSWLKTDLVSF